MACENIKIILNDREETTLYINNFYNNKDIIQRISRNNFEILCEYLFQKINESLNNALRDAKLKNEEIKEIVFVGGSTRIPRIKYILTDYFINAKINESINPDEIVAYGATLMAKNILLKKDSLSYFNFMDIVPFSLGINIKNNSLNLDIQKEGDLMDVIIKRGSLIPIQNVKEYFIIYDNQISIKIYEGEKKYVKYNHLLKEINLNGLSENPKKEVKIKVIFEIDVNGIITITIKEENKKDIFIDCVIKIDEVKLSNEEIEKLKEKNKKYMEKCKRKMNIDYKNIKETLRDVQNILNETKDEEDKFNILMCLNNILEEFIDNLEKDFDSLDNEIQLEKYYLYIKELFNSYNKVFKLKEYLDIGKKNKIMDNIKKYLNLFIKLNVGYLDDLLEIIKDLPIFYEIILFAMEKLNQCGKNCLKEMKKLCKYNSLKYFEKSKTLFSKYNIDRNKFLFIKLYKNYKIQMQICEEYIDDINSSLILLFEDNIKFDELILSETGFSGKSILEDKNEGYQSLKEYEKMLPKYEGKGNIKEAFILFKIITINYKLLGKKSFDMYKMGERIEFILKKINPKPKWYKEFNEIFTELEESLKIKENDREKIKRKYKTIFEEIEIFKERKYNREFIKYILQKYPYKGYEKDKNNRKFNNITAETLFYLRTKYCPDKYSFNFEDEDSQLNYCLMEFIYQLLNILYSNIN